MRQVDREKEWFPKQEMMPDKALLLGYLKDISKFSLPAEMHL